MLYDIFIMFNSDDKKNCHIVQNHALYEYNKNINDHVSDRTSSLLELSFFKQILHLYNFTFKISF